MLPGRSISVTYLVDVVAVLTGLHVRIAKRSQLFGRHGATVRPDRGGGQLQALGFQARVGIAVAKDVRKDRFQEAHLAGVSRLVGHGVVPVGTVIKDVEGGRAEPHGSSTAHHPAATPVVSASIVVGRRRRRLQEEDGAEDHHDRREERYAEANADQPKQGRPHLLKSLQRAVLEIPLG